MSEGPPSQQLLTGLQERAPHAHPAEEVEQRGEWWLRHAPGCAWWVGTALPHRDDDPGELLWRVGGVEQFYAARGAAAGFQITPGACPGRLDILLAQRRYRRHSPISLQVAPTGRVLERDATESGPPRVRVEGRPTSEWFEVWEAVTGSAADPRAEWDMLERVDRPSAYVSAYEGHDVVAVGRGVADTGWAGVFSMATRPEARRRGAGRNVLAALVDWAGARDAHRMFLQVECGNVAALHLYEQMGFTELCRYHYRSAR